MANRNPSNTRSGFQFLPADILLMIMVCLEDLPTLQRLVVAVPSVGAVFIAFFNAIISKILKKSLPEELQQYVYAIISARSTGPMAIKKLESFLGHHLGEQAEVKRPPATVCHSLASLEYMANVIEAVEFFLIFCIQVFSHGLQSPCCLLEKEPIKFRLRRALLRFQLFTELFHQPGDSTDSTSDWEERVLEQGFFWTQYLPWEVEECKCIYTVLAVCLRSNMENWKPRPAEDEDPIQHRGLPQLRNFIEDTTYTKFGLSYAHRFLDRALYGFSLVDPDDLNHFLSQYGNFYAGSLLRSEFPRRRPSSLMGHTKRWRRSRSPGIDLKAIGPNKERRTEVRLRGWCFWEGCELSFFPASFWDRRPFS